MGKLGRISVAADARRLPLATPGPRVIEVRDQPLVQRMQVFGTTIFAEIAALAVTTDSVNLGQGFPDTDGPQSLLDAVAEAITRGGHNQYPPGIGVPALRHAIAEHQRRFYQL